MSSQANELASSKIRLTLIGPKEPKELSADQDAIKSQIGMWQQLFSPDELEYSIRGFEDLFSHEKDELLVYDNFSPQSTRFTDFEQYREIWEREINEKFPGLILHHIEIDRILVDGNLAISAFTWWGSIVINGELHHTSQHATHVWRNKAGEWRIIHEHLTGPTIENGKESRR